MAKDHSNTHKAFVHSTEAWYYDAIAQDLDWVDEVVVGMFADDGCTSGEFIFRWERLAGSIVVRLYAFNDAWSALRNCSDLIDWMAEVDELNPCPEEFCAALKEMGYKDITARVNPRD